MIWKEKNQYALVKKGVVSEKNSFINKIVVKNHEPKGHR